MFYAQIFAGPNHKPCMTTMEGTYYIQETPGPWPEVFDGAFINQSVTSLGKTLVLSQNGEAVFLDPDQSAPEYWMAPTQPQFRKPSPPNTPPVKQTTPWLDKTIWDLPPDGKMSYTKVAFNDGRLFILNKPAIKGGAYDLVCYSKSFGRTPRHIPLQFHLSDKDRAALVVSPQGMSPTFNLDQIDHPDTIVYPSSEVQFFAAKQGLCIQLFYFGFWFVPYSDIEAYLKSSSH
jgi:hypothetical protein